ncbi:MAG: ABC transporter ATP-binding protein [Candidatus Contubernalis sp.]|nr:ABC transporter ATP-binding protein [Candidatus Contubernalis sp.]
MLIELENITKTFIIGEGTVTALGGISLVVKKGDFIAVKGASGSGKSTLLNILGCLDRPSSGTYILEGQKVSEMDESMLARVRNEKIGFVFQSFNLLPRMNALDNVILPFLYNPNPPVQAQDLARQALARVGLEDRGYHLPSARALINNPSIILADEPTGALDTRSGLEIMALLQEFNEGEGKTVIVITHEEEIAQHCHRIVTLSDGVVTTISDNNLNRRRAVDSLASLGVKT